MWHTWKSRLIKLHEVSDLKVWGSIRNWEQSASSQLRFYTRCLEIGRDRTVLWSDFHESFSADLDLETSTVLHDGSFCAPAQTRLIKTDTIPLRTRSHSSSATASTLIERFGKENSREARSLSNVQINCQPVPTQFKLHEDLHLDDLRRIHLPLRPSTVSCGWVHSFGLHMHTMIDSCIKKAAVTPTWWSRQKCSFGSSTEASESLDPHKLLFL